MRRIAEKITRLYYWLTIFGEGQGVKAKLLLIPSSLFRVIYYGTDVVKVPIIRDCFKKLVLLLSPSVVIRNNNGIFYCRRGGTDIQMVAELFEHGLTEYLGKAKAGVFVDIGAHIGRYTVKVGRQMGKNGKVVAIEPDPDNYEALKINIELNRLTNVRALNIACWNKTEELSLSLSSSCNKALSSLKEKVSRHYVQVEGMKLDEILANLGVEHVDLIKIDTEGAEEEVIQGAIGTIERSRNIQVIFEAWNQEYLERCKHILGKCGMVVSEYAIDRQTYIAKKA